MAPYVLAIETSCDDTSVAIVASPNQVLWLNSSAQDSIHRPFGGIVPELASRNHTLKILPLVEEAFKQTGLRPKDISAIAVTSRPGLLGSLMVGVVTAKSLALAWNKPIIGVNHLVGHIYAPFLQDAQFRPHMSFPPEPFLALAVSGGHTAIYQVQGFGVYTLLGKTRDDAAGEAFDKFAKMIGLGYPGGAQIDQQAQSGNAQKYAFPRPLCEEAEIAFSFSGLKSAAHRKLTNMKPAEIAAERAHLCASFQEAIVDCLLAKLELSQRQTQLKQIVITGGVSANSRLRAQGHAWANRQGLSLEIPPLRFCTDNAAMIGLVGLMQLATGVFDTQELSPSPRSLPTDFKTC